MDIDERNDEVVRENVQGFRDRELNEEEYENPDSVLPPDPNAFPERQAEDDQQLKGRCLVCELAGYLICQGHN